MYKIFLLFITTSMLWAYAPGGKMAPDIQQKLGLQNNKTYVIDFFASWCISCKHELPLIEKLSKQTDANVTVIGVDVDEDKQKGKAFQKELGLTFHIIDDSKGEIIKEFDPVGMPAVYIVKNGVVQKMILGAKDDIDQLILQAVKGL